jgi:flagellar hook protein FlgE
MPFYTSLSGLNNAQTDLNVISHNIANSETNGFKKSAVSFADVVASSVLTNPALTQGIGSTVQTINQNFSLGPIEQTGSALDLTINGDGFFTTVSPSSTNTIYTRDGAFKIDGQGYVINNTLNRLQAFPTDSTGKVTSTTSAAVQIPLTNAAGAQFSGVTVSNEGRITAAYADGSTQIIGAVSVANFVSPQGLKQLGSSSWLSTGLSGAATYNTPGTGPAGPMLSGALERSNVDLSEELVSLITAQSYFQANSKAIDTSSQILQTVIQLRN